MQNKRQPCSSVQHHFSIALHRRGTEAGSSTNFRFGKWVFPSGAGLCHLAREVTEEVTPCEFSYLSSSKMKKQKISKRCERGRVRSLLILASYMPAMQKPVLVNTSYVVGCGIPHSSPRVQKRKSLIAVIVCSWGYLPLVISTVIKYIKVKKGPLSFQLHAKCCSASCIQTLSVATLH